MELNSALEGIKDPINTAMGLGVALFPPKKSRPEDVDMQRNPLIAILLTAVVFIAIITVADLIQSICINVFLEPHIDDPVILRERRAAFVGNVVFTAIVIIFALFTVPLLLSQLQEASRK